MDIDRRSFLVGAGALLAMAGSDQSAEGRPNLRESLEQRPRPLVNRQGEGEAFNKVLLIMCDQWRFRMHWPGVPSIPLPSYQRLCQHGLEFTNACIAASACTPSRATIFSGKYGFETGATLTSGLHIVLGEKETYVGASPDNPRCQLPRPPQVKTVGHHFKEAGFSTYYKGKWHLSHVEGNWPKGAPEGLSDFGFEGWNPPEGHGKDASHLGYGADVSYIQDAVATLWDFHNRDLPNWFLVCSLINPHDIGAFPTWAMDIPHLGIQPPPSFSDSLANKPPCQAEFRKIWAGGTLVARRLSELRTRRSKRSDAELWDSYFQLYGHLTQMADSQVGILLDTLKETEQLDDTLVIFISDHGEQGGAHGMMQKWYQAYEESIRVPMVFSNPKLFRTGRQTDAMASLVDLAPTLLSMAGIPLPEGPHQLRGQDLSPVVRGQALSVQDDILFVSDDDIAAVSPYKAWTGPVSQPNRVRAVRNKQYKLVRYVGPDSSVAPLYELYDLLKDPNEMSNLARDPAVGAVKEQMSQRLDQLLKERYEQPPLYK